jgi:hypothetical protein
MAWTLFSVPAAKRTELDAALRDDLVSRQSQKVRAASSVGVASDAMLVLIEGADAAVRRAEELLAPLGTRLPPKDAEPIYRRLKEEEESASAGMGLFFTES